ncbi:hypothetical protein [Massilia scottii]|uniref:hypothetical protein n=1 Tax=Massilia scottii TaxID=3057166 RepID=UPI0027966B4C|nr:hypothetical protein [Massilia sp. CCM 9029]MDQ1829176.1 hypothetical protein [Massilia sp. CCM 9029]
MEASDIENDRIPGDEVREGARSRHGTRHAPMANGYAYAIGARLHQQRKKRRTNNRQHLTPGVAHAS